MGTKRFTGKLAEPILIKTRAPSLLTSTPDGRSEIEKHNRGEYIKAMTEQLKKLPLLYNRYGMTPSKDAVVNFALLSFRLAEEFIPGFRVKDLRTSSGKGRKKEWDVIKYCELLADVETLKRDKDRSDSEICNVLATSKRFSERWGKYNERTLKNQLIKARKAEHNVIISMYDSVQDKIPYDKYVETIIDSFSITKNTK